MTVLIISILLFAVIAIAISSKVRISSRYERAPKKPSSWNSLDKGIDPTSDSEDDQ
jgi:hypothetical protein